MIAIAAAYWGVSACARLSFQFDGCVPSRP